MRLSLLAIAAAFVATASPSVAADQRLLIVHGTIVDGSGGEPYVGSVRIQGDRIVAVGPSLAPEAGERVLDAGGHVVAPGFIDTHSHHDRGLLERRTVPELLTQGVTTAVFGQDGSSALPLADWLAAVEATPVAVNVASYAGHGTIRSAVMGDDFRRHATDAEVQKMKDILADEMRAGALGLATGLEYDPGIYSDPSEVLALAQVSAQAGGRYISHLRSEDRYFWQALDEIIHIGEVTRAPVQVSHMKLGMVGLWGQTDKLIGKLEAARARGVQITADAYPYEWWQSTMRVLFPARDFANRDAATFALDQVVKPDGLKITGFDAWPRAIGHTLLEVSVMRGEDPVTSLLSLVKMTLDYEAQHGDADDSVIGKGMAEDDVRKILLWQHTNLCSDGAASGGHPRGYGAFAKFIGRMVRVESLLPLSAAVHKATQLAAEHVGIRERGLLRAGYKADVVVFDKSRLIDQSTFDAPASLATGVDRVLVNGVEVYAAGQATGAYPGQVIRRL